MFGLGKISCVFCNERVPSKEAFRGHDFKDVAVCKQCYGKWEQAGRTCGQCKTRVQGTQEVSAFMAPRRTLGHADCGGIRFAR